MTPLLVSLRPSNEHILIVRVPRARDEHGCHSTPSYPPGAADLDIRAIHVPCFVAEQIPHGSHGIVYWIPMYPAGMRLVMPASSSGGALPESMKPGEIALTVMPWGASSLASVRVRIKTPALAM